MPLNFKFVSAGQALVDAPVFTQTLRGNSLRPLSPVNIHGTRDTLGSLLIQWTRRTRIGAGMIPGSDVPMAEENELYRVEILTSGDVLKRTMEVTNGSTRAAILVPQIEPAHIVGNTITAGGDTPTAYTAQILDQSGTWIEGTLKVSDDSSIAGLAIVEAAIETQA